MKESLFIPKRAICGLFTLLLLLPASLILCACVGCSKKQPAEQPVETSEDPVQAAYASILEKCDYGKALDRLSEPERILYLVRILEDEVNNGGFAQYFFNSDGNHANETPDAFLAIGAPETAELCRKANSIFGGQLPTEWKERLRILDSLPDDQTEDLLETCDDAFFASREDLHELERAYIRANAEAFADD